MKQLITGRVGSPRHARKLICARLSAEDVDDITAAYIRTPSDKPGGELMGRGEEERMARGKLNRFQGSRAEFSVD